MLRAAFVLLLLSMTLATPAHAQRYAPHKDGELPRIIFPDSLVSLNDKCAVAKRKLSTLIDPIYVNQLPIAFCCAPCPAIFSRNPAPYVKAIAPKLPCVVNPARAAVIDSAGAVFVDHDVFFFSDVKARAAFLADPLKYARHLTDPVSQVRFATTAKSPHLVYHGRNYYFESPDTFAQFQTNERAYAVRGGE